MTVNSTLTFVFFSFFGTKWVQTFHFGLFLLFFSGIFGLFLNLIFKNYEQEIYKQEKSAPVFLHKFCMNKTS